MKEEKGPQITVLVISLCQKLDMLKSCIFALSRVKTPIKVKVLLQADAENIEKARREVSSVPFPFHLEVLKKEEASTFAKNCNTLAEGTETPYLLFLNDDTFVREDFLFAPLRVMEADKDVGIVGSKCLYSDGLIQHAGIVFFAREGYRVASHVFIEYEGDHWLASVPREMQAVTGACFLIRRSLFEEFNGFSTEYENGWEDIDLCFRVRFEGSSKVVYCPSSVIIHHANQSRKSSEFDQKKNVETFLSHWSEEVVIDADLMHEPEYKRYVSLA